MQKVLYTYIFIYIFKRQKKIIKDHTFGQNSFQLIYDKIKFKKNICHIKDKIQVAYAVINIVIARGAINIKMYHWHASEHRK